MDCYCLLSLSAMQPCCEPGGIGTWRREPFAVLRRGQQAVSRKAAAGCRSPRIAHSFGRVILTDSPPISLFPAEIFPPHARTELSTMAMPNPVPPVSRVRDLSGR